VNDKATSTHKRKVSSFLIELLKFKTFIKLFQSKFYAFDQNGKKPNKAFTDVEKFPIHILPHQIPQLHKKFTPRYPSNNFSVAKKSQELS
jgi:hypothetical protein